MGTSRSTKRTRSSKAVSPLTVRLDAESKRCLAEAAELRRVSVSDYVRAVTLPQARREVRAAREHIIALTPEEQLSFWTALNEAPKFTEAQQRLGSLMRGEAGKSTSATCPGKL